MPGEDEGPSAHSLEMLRGKAAPERVWAWRIALWALVCGGAWPTGCSSPPPETEPDPCELDAGSLFGQPSSCDQEAAPDCEADPLAKGCPCLRSSRLECYSGAAATMGVGVCRAGLRRCRSVTWSACEGEVVPSFEACNQLDDDCDGLVDEGALSPCGGCNPECTGGVWGSESAPFDMGEGLALTPAGELTLARDENRFDGLWVPNTGEGTVSKIDPGRAVEVARYRTGGAPPTRVAVDYNGDAWVLGRALEGQSTLTKIAGLAAACVDANGDGLATSSGPQDVLAEGTDECVLFTVPVGAPGAIARSLSVDGARDLDGRLGGNVWVGLQKAQQLLEIDGRSGMELRTVAIDGLSPYASTFDPWGALWVADQAGVVGRIRPLPRAPEVALFEAKLACYALEALAVDYDGKLLLTGFSCENVIAFDPTTERWQQVMTSRVLTTRGVALSSEAAWVAHTAGSLSRVERDPLSIVDTFSLADEMREPVESIGVAVDGDDQVWVVSTLGGAAGQGVATRFDPTRGEVTAQVDVGLGPRGQGDLTGGKLVAEFAPEATTSHVFVGCQQESTAPDVEPTPLATEWRAVHLHWSAGVDSSVVVEARHAEDRDSLAGPFATLGSVPQDDPPLALDVPTGGVLELRLTLRSAQRIGAPRVGQVGVEWRCPGPD